MALKTMTVCHTHHPVVLDASKVVKAHVRILVGLPLPRNVALSGLDTVCDNWASGLLFLLRHSLVCHINGPLSRIKYLSGVTSGTFPSTVVFNVWVARHLRTSDKRFRSVFEVRLVGFEIISKLIIIESVLNFHVRLFEVERLLVRNVSYSLAEVHGVILLLLFNARRLAPSLSRTSGSTLLRSVKVVTSIRRNMLVPLVPFLQVSNFVGKWLRGVINRGTHVALTLVFPASSVSANLLNSVVVTELWLTERLV